jgi:hypothetical protein
VLFDDDAPELLPVVLAVVWAPVDPDVELPEAPVTPELPEVLPAPDVAECS